MAGQDERDGAASLCEEIAALARAHLIDSDRDGLQAIDRQCSDALAEGRWDDVGKWHRVRLRYLRFRQQRDLRTGEPAFAKAPAVPEPAPSRGPSAP
jgi:hypothetical protein